MAETPCSALLEDWLRKLLRTVIDPAPCKVVGRELASLKPAASLESMGAFKWLVCLASYSAS